MALDNGLCKITVLKGSPSNLYDSYPWSRIKEQVSWIQFNLKRATLKPGIRNPESQYNTERKNYPKHS